MAYKCKTSKDHLDAIIESSNITVDRSNAYFEQLKKRVNYLLLAVIILTLENLIEIIKGFM